MLMELWGEMARGARAGLGIAVASRVLVLKSCLLSVL